MGTLSLAAPLVLFEKSRLWAGTGFHLLPSFHHHPTQHNNTTQTVTLTVILTSTIHYTDTHPIRNVVCPSGAWFENRPHLMPSIHLAWNPKHVIVQWVGIGTHTHTHTLLTESVLTDFEILSHSQPLTRMRKLIQYLFIKKWLSI